MPVHARFVDDIKNATKEVKTLPPMVERKNPKTGKTYSMSTKTYALRVIRDDYVDPLSPDKYPYWKVTLGFADEEDIQKYGNWGFYDIYSQHPNIKHVKNIQVKRLCENLGLPYNGEGIAGKIVHAILTTRSYMDAQGKDAVAPSILRLEEWSEPKAVINAPLHHHKREQKPQGLHDEIPF